MQGYLQPYADLVLSNGLIMWIGHRKEIRKLTFRALALRRIRPDEGLTLETSAFESRWPIYIINPVDKTNLSCNTPTDAAPQFF